jgi:hypothetical protein
VLAPGEKIQSCPRAGGSVGIRVKPV